MNLEELIASLDGEAPSEKLSPALAALWWDRKGDWERAHSLVDELSDKAGMAVHAYLHRKEGSEGNAEYWYRLAGDQYRRKTFEAEWAALAEAL